MECRKGTYEIINMLRQHVCFNFKPVNTDIKEMLEYDCKESSEALPMMSKSLTLFDDDYVTKRMIEEFIIDEQDHFNRVKGHLCLIEQIGIENYIIEMLGE